MSHEFWYLSRAAGFTAYLLLFVSVALGISMGTRLVERFIKRNTIFDLHRFTTLLALVFTLFHVYILLLDGFFNFNLWELSVPFLSPYRSWQTATGIFALYALVIVIGSFYLRRFIGYRAWRALHFTTFAMFALAALHGIAAGTDTTELWARAIYVLTSCAAIALIFYRIQYRLPKAGAARTLRVGSAVAMVAIAAAILFGTTLLRPAGSSADPAAAATGSTDAAGATTVGLQGQYRFLQSFSTSFNGTFAQTQDATNSHLTLDGVTSGDLLARVHLELEQVIAVPTPDNEAGETDPNDNEAAEMQPASTVALNTASLMDADTNTTLCTGEITTLNQGYLALNCQGSGPYSGVQMTVTSRVTTSADGRFTGALNGTMRRLS